MDGLLLVDKPAGWTSHDVAAYVKRALGVKRAGHTGTLDPDATGLVIVLVGRATRLARYYEHDAKAYSAVMRLGAETDTQDASGEIVNECPVPEFGRDGLESVIAGFVGEISQLPPMYSAVKVDGRRLYKAARQGEEVERRPRTVTVHELSLTSFDGTRAGFDVVCSKGTYIRTLCRDIAEALGTCGHMESLRRTRSGGYSVENAVGLAGRPGAEELSASVIPVEKMLPAMPEAVAGEEVAARIRDGVAPYLDELVLTGARPGPGEAFKILGPDGRIAAFAEASGDPDTGRIRARLDIVFN